MYTNHLQFFRTQVSKVTDILYYAVDRPFTAIVNSALEYQSSKQVNDKLRQELVKLEAKVQQLHVLRSENKQLRGLLAVKQRLAKTDVIITQLMRVQQSRFPSYYTIDKGSKDGAYTTQPVLDAHGVFGQVILTNATTSKILLVTDSQVMIPVQNARTNSRGLLQGGGVSTNKLLLINTPVDSDIAINDLYFASGLANKYPYGYPVGKVTGIDTNSGNGFATIELEPTATLQRGNFLMLLTQALEHNGK